MWRRSKYDWMLFLTSPIAVTGVQTHKFPFTKPCALTPQTTAAPCMTRYNLYLNKEYIYRRFAHLKHTLGCSPWGKVLYSLSLYLQLS